MAKQKVSELPKEEQDALLNEAKEAGLRMGLVQGWTVETLKKRIEEAKANKTGDGDGETDGESGEGETPEGTETTDSEDGEENGDAPENEESNEGDNETPEETPPVETPQAPKKAKKEPEEEKTYICHICRSKVTKGKCTGCGFSVGG